MNIALTVAASAAITLLVIAGSTPARASEIEIYRTDHERADCHMVETRTTNRWGDEVTIRQRVCN
ncbi:MAG TPA: hypothetical protein VGG01_12405 [Xanthobacteraceae bacterium]|jgi:hypothetical protein